MGRFTYSNYPRALTYMSIMGCMLLIAIIICISFFIEWYKYQFDYNITVTAYRSEKDSNYKYNFRENEYDVKSKVSIGELYVLEDTVNVSFNASKPQDSVIDNFYEVYIPLIASVCVLVILSAGAILIFVYRDKLESSNDNLWGSTS